MEMNTQSTNNPIDEKRLDIKGILVAICFVLLVTSSHLIFGTPSSKPLKISVGDTRETYAHIYPLYNTAHNPVDAPLGNFDIGDTVVYSYWQQNIQNDHISARLYSRAPLEDRHDTAYIRQGTQYERFVGIVK